MNNRKVFGGLVAVTVLALGAFLLPSTHLYSGEKPGRLFKPDNNEIVQLGQQIYAENCASCHGANLEGQTSDWRSPGPDGKLPAPPHDASGHTWHHTDELLFSLTKYGLAEAAGRKNYESNMPIYKDILTDDEIIAVMSFIKSTWPDDLRNRHDELNAVNFQ